MPKLVTKIGVCSFAIFSLALTGCPSPRQGSQNARLPYVPNPMENRNNDANPKPQTPNTDQAPVPQNPIPSSTATPVPTPKIEEPANPENNKQDSEKVQPKPQTPSKVDKATQMIFETADGVDSVLKQACAVAICGQISPTQITADDIVRGRINQTQKAKQLFSSEIKPLIDQHLEVERKKAEIYIGLYKAKKAQVLAAQATADQTKLINAFWTTNNLNRVFKTLNQDYDIDPARFDIEFKELSEYDKKALKSYAATFVGSPLMGDLMSINQVSFDDMLKLKYKIQDPTALAQTRVAYATALNSRIDALKKRFPTLPVNASRGLHNLAKGKDVEPIALKNLSNDIVLAIINGLVENEIFGIRKVDLSPKIKEFYGKLETSFTEGLKPERAQKIEALCSVTVNQITEMNLSKEEVASFASAINTIKQAAKKQLPKFTNDATSQQKAAEEIDKLEFNFPSTSEERILGLKNQIKAEIAEIRLENIKAPKLNDSDLAMFAYLSADSDKGTNSNQSACADARPEGISDFALSGHGKIYISWQTIRFADTGPGVLAHEMGHIVSGILRSTNSSNYTNAKTCTADRHGDQKLRTGSDEEDFADVFAAKVMNDLQGIQKNTGCLLVGNAEAQTYGNEVGLSLKYPANYPDTHSPSFYRMVQQEIERGRQLPASCQKVVAQGLPAMDRVCAK